MDNFDFSKLISQDVTESLDIILRSQNVFYYYSIRLCSHSFPSSSTAELHHPHLYLVSRCVFPVVKPAGQLAQFFHSNTSSRFLSPNYSAYAITDPHALDPASPIDRVARRNVFHHRHIPIQPPPHLLVSRSTLHLVPTYQQTLFDLKRPIY
jgi:hypothetical protein